jgi:hypothetical protein
MASAGMGAIGEYKLPLGIRVGKIFEASIRTGSFVREIRENLTVRHKDAKNQH